MGRFSDIIKVVEQTALTNGRESFCGRETLFIWQCYTLPAIPALRSNICAPPEYLICAWLQK